jgi:hypothetical protein
MPNFYTVTFIGQYTTLSTTIVSDLDPDDPEGIVEEAIAYVLTSTGVDINAARLGSEDIDIDPA